MAGSWQYQKPPNLHTAAHQKARKTWAARHRPTDPCARCGQPLGPMGPWLHLGDWCESAGVVTLALEGGAESR